MRLVTVATESQAYFPYLLKSCARHKATLDVLGWGMKWRGFVWRMHLLTHYLDQLDDDEIVCVIDSYDVLMLRPLKELEEAFLAFCADSQYDVIVGGERPPSIAIGLGMRWMFGTCRGKFLNAGTYIGFVKGLKDVVRGVRRLSNDDVTADDQLVMTQYCSKEKAGKRLYIDRPNDFFLTMTSSSKLPCKVRIEDGKLFYRNKQPFFIHANGQADMNDIVLKLGYSMTARERQEIVSYLKVTTFKKTFVYMPYFNVCLIPLLLACLAYVWHKVYRKR